MTVLPKSLLNEVAEQIEKARVVWEQDRLEGRPGVYLGWKGVRVFIFPVRWRGSSGGRRRPSNGSGSFPQSRFPPIRKARSDGVTICTGKSTMKRSNVRLRSWVA